MTGNVYDRVWRECPMGKFLVGRRKIDQLTEIAIGAWPMTSLDGSMSNAEKREVARLLEKSVERIHEVSEPKYHFVIWAILLQALASAIIRILIEWWLESDSHRLRLLAVQQEIMK